MSEADQKALDKLEGIFRRVWNRKEESFDKYLSRFIKDANEQFASLEHDCRVCLLRGVQHVCNHRVGTALVLAPADLEKAVRRGNLARLLPKEFVTFEVFRSAVVDAVPSVGMRVAYRRSQVA